MQIIGILPLHYNGNNIMQIIGTLPLHYNGNHFMQIIEILYYCSLSFLSI